MVIEGNIKAKHITKSMAKVEQNVNFFFSALHDIRKPECAYFNTVIYTLLLCSALCLAII